jgi:integrase
VGARGKSGGWSQNRTGDTRIFSPLLYRLSYPAITFTCNDLRSIFKTSISRCILPLYPLCSELLMTEQIETTTGGLKPLKTRRNERLSADGLWESFPKVPGLLRYVPSGTYFGRCKVNGKVKRRTLDTDVFTTGKLRLPDILKELRKPEFIAGTFGEARADYERETKADHTLAEASCTYRLRCLDRLVKTWPGLDKLPVDKITEVDCKAWAARLAKKYAPQFFNNIVVYFRIVLTRAGLSNEQNPAMKIQRLGIKPKRLILPEPDEFNRLLTVVETSGAVQAQDCADLIRFLAYSGTRISESKQVIWADVDMKREKIRVRTAKRRKTSSEAEYRDVPIVPPMRALLERLKRERNPQPTDRVNILSECQGALTRGCKIVGIHRLTHHDMRHLFASVCIEAGVDMQTLSRWLGHSDGGELAQRTYGHLRQQHSQDMARRVTFGQTVPENVVELAKVGAA